VTSADTSVTAHLSARSAGAVSVDETARHLGLPVATQKVSTVLLHAEVRFASATVVLV